ncbi:hypothetical protein A2U01_0017054 [Trifolium medium]|uniref:Uncharacterized protein n=1 Tax=Trifolium medium TaxID=97028 RepID=A0A392N8I6_9FABA|nr:hypothetical protein [Trifolium medium]
MSLPRRWCARWHPMSLSLSLPPSLSLSLYRSLSPDLLSLTIISLLRSSSFSTPATISLPWPPSLTITGSLSLFSSDDGGQISLCSFSLNLSLLFLSQCGGGGEDGRGGGGKARWRDVSKLSLFLSLFCLCYFSIGCCQ